VPRGPNVLIRLRSFQSAQRTVSRVAPLIRNAPEASPAEMTWACNPLVAAATTDGSVPSSIPVTSP
jgi:hypothetical protein